MATFQGTKQEFRRYIGPRPRNLVQQLTKKQKAAVGACEHCGVGGELESAHVHGRERGHIIDLLLEELEGPTDALVVDLEQFEAAFAAEHKPIEKTLLILCNECHRRYDALATQRSVSSGPAVAARQSSEQDGPSASDVLPITLDPPQMDAFKASLLRHKAAEITIFYGDGRIERRPWNASKFSAASNLFGNLRSRPEFRQGEWQSRRIAKVHVWVRRDGQEP